MSKRWVIYKMVRGRREFVWSGPFGTTMFGKHVARQTATSVYTRLRADDPDGEYRLLSER